MLVAIIEPAHKNLAIMNQKKLLLFIEDALQKATDQKISEALPRALTIAKLLDDKDFENWILLEASGYFNTNQAFKNGVHVPTYRSVPVQFFDIYKRPLIIENPNVQQMVCNYRLRDGVAELEILSNKNTSLSMRDPFLFKRVNELLHVEVDTLTFSSNSVNGILSEIRTTLISWIIDKQKQISNNLDVNPEDPEIPKELSSLHPIVQKTAGALFMDGHYRSAILDSYIALVEAVQVKSGMLDLDNTTLMQTVFSAKNPIIKISNSSDEQLGFMWLFSGAVMAIRNPKAHRLISQRDPQRTLEWLNFASVLFRVLDDSKLIIREKVEDE